MYHKILQNRPKTINAAYQIVKHSALQIFIAVAFLAIVPANETTAQETEVSGFVLGAEDNQPLPGANILLKGTDIGTSTGLNGSFSIEAKEGDILVVSYVGYKSQEVVVGTGRLTIRLIADILEFETLVVLGSHGKLRTNVDRPVPIDVISAREIDYAGQVDMGQALHFIAPSFNSFKFGINDLAPLVDPATLRG